MKSTKKFLAAFAAVSVSLLTPAVAAPGKGTPAFVHNVEKGDSLSRISRFYHVTVGEIVQANLSIKDPALIKTGTLLAVPLPVIRGKDGQITYSVRPGDSLAEIAAWFKTSAGELTRANKLEDADSLAAWRKLSIPLAKPAKPARAHGDMAVYRTNSPESLSAIAGKLSITTADLRRVNAAFVGVLDETVIPAGVALVIPAVSPASPVSSPTASIVTAR